MYERTLPFDDRFRSIQYMATSYQEDPSTYVHFYDHNFLHTLGHPRFPHSGVGAMPTNALSGLVQHDPVHQPVLIGSK